MPELLILRKAGSVTLKAILNIMKQRQPAVAEPILPAWEASNSPEDSAYLQPQLLPLPGPELSIIVPTFNERENVRELVDRVEKCLETCSWEIIFVDDDSPDGT